jgi:hypothetical protein
MADQAKFLEWAGLSKDDLQRAADVLRDALGAVDTQYFSHQGRVLDSREHEAWRTRISAAKELIGIFGLRPSVSRKRENHISVDVEIHPGLKR